MKKSKKTIVGIVLLVIGIIGIIGVFFETEDKISLIAGSITLIVVGGVLILIGKKSALSPTVQHPFSGGDAPTVQQSLSDGGAPTVTQPSSGDSASTVQHPLSGGDASEEKHPLSGSSLPPVVNPPAVKGEDDNLERKKALFSAVLSSIPRVEITYSTEKMNRRQPSDMPEIKFTNITRATKVDRLFPLVVIDTETTGIQVRGNDIIEVSAIKYDVGFQPVSCFTTLLKPRGPIPPETTEVNNITDDMVKDCKPFSAVARAFSDYISGCNIVGHKLPFDLKFLYVCGADLPENVRYYDTLDLARKTLKAAGGKEYDHHSHTYHLYDDYDVENYKLTTLCDYYGIYRDGAHRSLSDCLATAMLFENLIDDKTA